MKLLGLLSAVVGLALIAASVLAGGQLMDQAGISGGTSAYFFFSFILFMAGLVFLAISRFLIRSGRSSQSGGYEITRPEDGL